MRDMYKRYRLNNDRITVVFEKSSDLKLYRLDLNVLAFPVSRRRRTFQMASMVGAGSVSLLPLEFTKTGGKWLATSYMAVRTLSTLTHVDKTGKARMVDVGTKGESNRVAVARATVQLDNTITRLIRENNMKKGDVLTVAQLAGIMAAKRTPDLIPLCHTLSLSYAAVSLRLDDERHRIEISSEIRCTGQTGVEMEALTAVSVAALTVYDMCKSVASPKALKITDIELVSKTGGTKGDFFRDMADHV